MVAKKAVRSLAHRSLAASSANAALRLHAPGAVTPRACCCLASLGLPGAAEEVAGEHQLAPGAGDEVRQVHAGHQDIHQVHALRQG